MNLFILFSFPPVFFLDGWLPGSAGNDPAMMKRRRLFEGSMTWTASEWMGLWVICILLSSVLWPMMYQSHMMMAHT